MSGPPQRRESGRFPRGAPRLAPILLWLLVGCSPLVDSQCGPAPRSTDAAATGIAIQNEAPPCTYSNEGIRGSNGHLVAHLDCPGESDPFLVAVKVDGKLLTLVEAHGAGYGTQVSVDAGPWEAADNLWHSVELIVDPLNLFRETNEANNRLVGQVRTIPPEIGIFSPATRFLDPNAGYVEVSQITAGNPVVVVLTAIAKGRYQSVELSAKSGVALDQARTLTMGSCDAISGGAPQVNWVWTPPGPGTYPVEFRVRVLSGEGDSDPNNNLLTKDLTVVPPGPAAPARAAPR